MISKQTALTNNLGKCLTNIDDIVCSNIDCDSIDDYLTDILGPNFADEIQIDLEKRRWWRSTDE